MSAGPSDIFGLSPTVITGLANRADTNVKKRGVDMLAAFVQVRIADLGSRCIVQA
jgi:hypothetical protein